MNSLFNIPNVTGYDFNLLGGTVELIVHQSTSFTTIRLLPADKDKPITTPLAAVPDVQLQPKPAVRRRKARRAKAITPSRPFIYAHQRSNGTRVVTKLSENEVREIRELWPTVLEESQSQNDAKKKLAQLFNISASNIGAIINRTTWTHVA